MLCRLALHFYSYENTRDRLKNTDKPYIVVVMCLLSNEITRSSVFPANNFCSKNIFQMFSFGYGNVKMSSFLNVGGMFFKASMTFQKPSFNLTTQHYKNLDLQHSKNIKITWNQLKIKYIYRSSYWDKQNVGVLLKLFCLMSPLWRSVFALVGLLIFLFQQLQFSRKVFSEHAVKAAREKTNKTIKGQEPNYRNH